MDEHKTLIRATFDGRIAALSDRCYTNSLLTAHGFTAIAATHHHQRFSSKKRQYSQAHLSSSRLQTHLFILSSPCILNHFERSPYRMNRRELTAAMKVDMLIRRACWKRLVSQYFY